MDDNNQTLFIGASILNISNKNINNNLNTMLSVLSTTDDTEVDILNDETFGDCNLDTIKMKSDFGENGEFLGDYTTETLPDFFDSNISDKEDEILLIDNNNDQSQQPSIDALLGEDPMSLSTSINLRQSTMNPLFNIAISQANNIFSQQQTSRISPIILPSSSQQQINYQLLKQFEQMLINQQIPRNTINTTQQQTTRVTNMNINGHNQSNEINSNQILNNNLLYDQQQRQPTHSMAIVLQLLKSIQQENELAQRLSQTSAQVTFSNVNPIQSLPYASRISTQLGKQSMATPRHPRCILHLDGQFTLGIRANAITHDKYTLGLLLNIENIYRDILRLNNDRLLISNQIKTETELETVTIESKQLLSSIIDHYLNHQQYLFADMFGQFNKGQIIFERLYPYLKTTNYFELLFIRFYSSLSYMIYRWSTTFHIEPIVMNTISLIQQQIISNKTTFEQLLTQVYTYYNEQIKEKLTEFHSAASSSPFSDPVLFTNSYSVTILIELLLILERQCYLSSSNNSSTLPLQVMQQLQYQLTEYIRLFITDLCQALIACSSPVYTLKKILKPFAHVKHQQFGLLCKFLRIQISQNVYTELEPKLIYCCIKDT
ncbi:unnamed protein product [Rotaria sordida]|uniref:Uncharacterized protein n=1 Tax=Rotaria sordida TaxID=392033 RepID=A0A814W294_9BILA|nr:unnamed protein product [Rotaria sordida]CAF1471640.1 unnamed protein product [Rotaria sordida]